MDKQTKNKFIYDRINDYGQFLSLQNYSKFLESFGIEYSNFNENYNFNDEQIDQLFPILQYPSQKELNLLSLYYLYSLALTLIKSFIQTTAMSYVKKKNYMYIRTTFQSEDFNC
ncbi:hypothetical protein Mgra_00009651 [Meloidogyne graminicola]|uniref:Uncharacterized protein n=1 Tax=Meloidogyne graminicola TaxID=189291 RepID=A0A8S9ZBE1_9BILA|nr:hypothetical protein Mgra_00009651 [Meloidogyne graminicola]